MRSKRVPCWPLDTWSLVPILLVVLAVTNICTTTSRHHAANDNSHLLPSSMSNTGRVLKSDERAAVDKPTEDNNPDPKCQGCKSGQWSPYIVGECQPSMPKYWAPCLANAARAKGVCVLKAEELIYPDVQFLLPGFVSAEQREAWLAQDWITKNSLRYLHIPRQDDHTAEYVVVLSSKGQNWVFCNTRYTDDPFPDEWAPTVEDNWAGTINDNHCLGGHNRIFQFTQQEPDATDLIHESLAIFNTPQAYAFQHFSDHTAKVLAQSEHLIDRQTDILAMRTIGMIQSNSVYELWEMMPHIDKRRIIYGSDTAHWAKVSLCHVHLVDTMLSFSKRIIH